MKKFLFFAAAVAALLTSCQKENGSDDSSVKGVKTITASIGNSTKVVMGTDDGTDTKLNWEIGDNLLTINMSDMSTGKYSADNAGETASFSLADESEGLNPESAHLAVYPYENMHFGQEWLGLKFTFSGNQNYTANSFDKSAMPLLATNGVGETNFTFNAMAPVLRLKVKLATAISDVKVNSVVIESAHNNLAGTSAPANNLGCFIEPDPEYGDVSKSITLDCSDDEGVAINNTAATQFCIVLPPNEYPSGDLTITIKTNKGNIVKTSKAAAIFVEGKVYNLNISGEPVANTPDPGIFTLTASGDKATIRITHSGLQYQTTNQDWSPYTSYTLISLEDGQFIQFKAADGATHTTISRSFEIFGPVEASGSVMTLLPDGTEMGNYAFKQLFLYCTGLKTAPELPAETLKNGCYESMFVGCTSLETAPTLPAETLGNYSYRYMFQGCTSLETAPELPATSMKTRCYESMFEGCTSLETAPELPATSLANYCYTNMFKGCSNLREIHVSFTSWHSNATNGWVDGVQYSGDFYCPSSLASESSTTDYGINKVPEGWAIHNE